MNRLESRSHGFTIVELLIVVVVIAILAAITIVSYNGITGRAKATAAQSSAKQAFTKLQSYSILNSGTYPETLSDAGLNSSENSNYQYRVDNSASPATFCITATISNVSYYISNSDTTPIAGACPGHGSNGAQATTNYVTNPRMISGGSTVEMGPRFGWSRSYQTTGGPSGIPTYTRFTVNTGSVGFGRGVDWYINPDTAPSDSANSKTVAVTAGETVTVSAWVRTSQTVDVSLGFRIHTGTAWLTSYSSGTYTSVPQNQWTRISRTIPITATGYLALRNHVNTNDWVSTDYIEQTGLMITKSNSLLEYADGTSPGWVWNGGTNSSSSSGPVL